MNTSQDPAAPPDAAFPTRVPVTPASVAAYVADSIAVKQVLLADAALLDAIAATGGALRVSEIGRAHV